MARAFGIGPADHDKFLAVQAFGLNHTGCGCRACRVHRRASRRCPRATSRRLSHGTRGSRRSSYRGSAGESAHRPATLQGAPCARSAVANDSATVPVNGRNRAQPRRPTAVPAKGRSLSSPSLMTACALPTATEFNLGRCKNRRGTAKMANFRERSFCPKSSQTRYANSLRVGSSRKPGTDVFFDRCEAGHVRNLTTRY
jgi:hypothetical protein